MIASLISNEVRTVQTFVQLKLTLQNFSKILTNSSLVFPILCFRPNGDLITT